MIALRIFGAVAGWILCGALVYAIMMWCAKKEMTDEEKACRLLVSILLAPGLFFFCVVVVMVFGLFKICLFVVGHKKEEYND